MTRKRTLLRERARAALREAARQARERPTPRRLSEEIAALRDHFTGTTPTLGQIVSVLQVRAWTLVLILLALPFITPIPLPFLSTPFGLSIACISLRLALGQRPWLPKRLLDRPLNPGFLDALLRNAHRLIAFLEKFLRPRLSWLATGPLLPRLHACAILIAALVLMLPLPIPFSNSLPAWLILLLAGGLLERDGAAVLAGYGIGAGGIAFFYYLGEWAIKLMEQIKLNLSTFASVY